MDNAFEKARAAYGTGAFDDATLEFIFPQLKESEDERIRQLIYSSIKNDMPIASPKNKELALAWLEKQKEQKPASLTKYVYSKENKRFIRDCANILIANDYETSAKRLLAMFEQKPAEKEITLTSFEGTLNTFLFDFANSPIEDCEPKEYIKKHSAEILKAAYKELNAKLQQDIFEARQEGIRDGYEVAKAEQKPAEIAPNQFDGITYGMQGYSTEKPAEWSEEDELTITDLINYFEGDSLGCSAEEMVQRIKSLRPQPKQEWSEEDDYNIAWLIETLLGLDGDKEFTSKCKEKARWLKSLRPQPRVEWSELDKLTLDSIVSIVEDWESQQSEEEKEYYGATQKSDWLKSLPHRFSLSSWGEEIQTAFFGKVNKEAWRPSEEQKPKQEVPADTEVITAKLVNLLKSYRIGEETATGLANRIADTYGTQRYLDGLCDGKKDKWKPNEEQMDRLFSIVAALRKDYCDDMADFLASIYKQLKAL